MKAFLIAILITRSFIGISQDSTLLPRNPLGAGKFIEHSYFLMEYVPKYLSVAIDSVNGGHLKIYDKSEHIKQRGDISPNDKREFRALIEDRTHWLMTYVHWEGKRHTHFVVFAMQNNRVSYITTGISDYEIDSITTIERLKATKQVTFINLKSKQNFHKF